MFKNTLLVFAIITILLGNPAFGQDYYEIFTDHRLNMFSAEISEPVIIKSPINVSWRVSSKSRFQVQVLSSMQCDGVIGQEETFEGVKEFFVPSVDVFLKTKKNKLAFRSCKTGSFNILITITPAFKGQVFQFVPVHKLSKADIVCLDKINMYPLKGGVSDFILFTESAKMEFLFVDNVSTIFSNSQFRKWDTDWVMFQSDYPFQLTAGSEKRQCYISTKDMDGKAKEIFVLIVPQHWVDIVRRKHDVRFEFLTSSQIGRKVSVKAVKLN